MTAAQTLLARLHRPAPIRFGMQDAPAYGTDWSSPHPWRTDVHDVCGKHPAVFGWDLGRLGDPANLDGVPFHRMREWMAEVHRRGGINTVSWHLDNPMTGGDSWDTKGRVVPALLTVGPAREAYRRQLDRFADFSAATNHLPFIFRPLHEHTGHWFWWGHGHRTPAEYAALWRFTHDYLTRHHGLTNLLWAYSPDRFKDRAHYFECYPGDDCVDVFGLDEYHHLSAWWKQKDFLRRLRTIVELAEERGKVAALTETGLETIPRTDWWTKCLLQPIIDDPVARRIKWLLVWRNHSRDHHFGPYPAHRTADDFRRFAANPGVAFLEDAGETVSHPRDPCDCKGGYGSSATDA